MNKSDARIKRESISFYPSDTSNNSKTMEIKFTLAESSLEITHSTNEFLRMKDYGFPTLLQRN